VLFADLGVSSTQLEDASRGFSFQRDGPLDMRMDPRLEVTAADLVNRLKERQLGDLFYHNAQEFRARRIARRICEARRDKRITRTGQLVRIVAGALGVDADSRRAKIHPATRTFMALRIAVNQEITNLESLLAAAPERLRPGGRIGIIAFHSVEDKPVKMDFRRRKNDGIYRIVTKKPVTADAEERRSNPRARSAKLRVAIRLPEEKEMNKHNG
jgi:16S rRNA (cytosine1402-N4)-methyltransferase